MRSMSIRDLRLVILGLAATFLTACADQRHDVITSPPAADLSDASALAVAATLDWSPSGNHDYGPVDVGQPAPQTFMLTNSSGSSTGRVSISLSGSAEFSITSDACTGSQLPKGKSCAITVQFAPAIAGQPATATLTASGKRVAASATVTLDGHGALLLAPFTSGDLVWIAPGQFATVSSDLTAEIAVVSLDQTGDLVCFAIPSLDVVGKIAVIARGLCNFSTKIRYAQQGGAVAVIIVNTSNEFFPLPQDGTANQPTIPAYLARSFDIGILFSMHGHQGTIGATLTRF